MTTNIDTFLKETIHEAGMIAKSFYEKGFTVTTKSYETDFLTEADTAVSEFLVGKIHTTFPDHHIKSEEMATDINSGSEYEWVIDPIDGTHNFAKKMPFWGVMIAVLRNGERYMGSVYFPLTDELFFAERGKGATLNGQTISVSKREMVERALGNMFRASPGGPYGEHFERYRMALARLIIETNTGMRSYGSSASLCYLANGAVDFAVGNAGLDWDYLPTTLICEEAGAVVTDSDGNPWQRGRQDYIMTNPNLHPKILEYFKPASV